MIDRSTAPHFNWGQGCDGWRLVSESTFAVIEERMPPGTAEVHHYHRVARQFFYVLRGELTIETDGHQHRLIAGQGLEIAPGVAHEVANHSAEKVEFLLISAPPSDNDRVLAKSVCEKLMTPRRDDLRPPSRRDDEAYPFEDTLRRSDAEGG